MAKHLNIYIYIYQPHKQDPRYCVNQHTAKPGCPKQEQWQEHVPLLLCTAQRERSSEQPLGICWRFAKPVAAAPAALLALLRSPARRAEHGRGQGREPATPPTPRWSLAASTGKVTKQRLCCRTCCQKRCQHIKRWAGCKKAVCCSHVRCSGNQQLPEGLPAAPEGPQ
jgi:hypothetical protein